MIARVRLYPSGGRAPVAGRQGFVTAGRACYDGPVGATAAERWSPKNEGMGSVRRSYVFVLLCLWILTTGSTCQSTVQGGSLQVQGNNGGAVLVVLVAVGVACLANPEACGGREPTPLDKVRMTFESGLDLLDRGDPAGLDRICIAGFQGDARAQYFYGIYLLRQGPTERAASLAWLKRAAAQDHKAARYVLAQLTGRAAAPGPGPVRRPQAVPPPALHACLTGPRPGRAAPTLEAARGAADRNG